jgi:nicotinate-nucleotide pyrophosphorylase (carboxylating)
LVFRPNQELRKFLAEDIGKGDITSKLLEKKQITAKIITRQNAVISGTVFAKQIFALKKCKTKIIKKDGMMAKPNQVILEIKGDASAILNCERTVLNLLSRMCGISTKTNALCILIKKLNNTTKLFATRKTAPGLRYFDKIAVEVGGGQKHRMSLSDMIMFKDNHLAVEKSIFSLIKKAKKSGQKIEIEVESEKDAILVATLGVDIIMLDNFTPNQIKNTVLNLNSLKLRENVKLEASGRINEKNILQYAKTGVDMISVGEITNSAQGIDLSLEVN